MDEAGEEVNSHVSNKFWHPHYRVTVTIIVKLELFYSLQDILSYDNIIIIIIIIITSVFVALKKLNNISYCCSVYSIVY